MENILSIVGVTCFTAYLLKAYFESSIVMHIVSKISGKNIYTFEEYENYVISRFPSFISSLLLCRICLAFHASYIVTILFLLCGTKFSFSEILTAVGISSFVSSFEFKFLQKFNNEENKLEVEPSEETNIANKNKKETENKDKNSQVKDVGGLLIDYTDKKPVFIGYTELYTSHAEKIFDESKKCDFPKCENYKAAYNKELEKLKESFSQKGETCPKCNISSLKRKYYDIIKAEYKKNGHT
jgi:hypothetical protein